MNRLRKLVMIFPLATLAACAMNPDRNTPSPSMDERIAGLTEQDGRACVRIRDIDGYAPVSDRIIGVSGRRDQYFLVTTLFRCFGLESTMGVAFEGSFSEVCGGAGRNAIITPDESCPIGKIYRFSSREEAMKAIEMARDQQEVEAILEVD